MSITFRKVSAGSQTRIVMLFRHRRDYDEARAWFHERNISTSNDVIGFAVKTMVNQSHFDRLLTVMVSDDQMVEINLRWRQAV